MAWDMYPNFVSSTKFPFSISMVDMLIRPEPHGIELKTSLQTDINL